MPGLACCAIEMMAAGRCPLRPVPLPGWRCSKLSPRQADIMIVAGRVSQKMAPVLRQVYDQMMEPKWVISMGVCASSGGMFNNYAIVQGVDQVVPVDVLLRAGLPADSGNALIHASRPSTRRSKTWRAGAPPRSHRCGSRRADPGGPRLVADAPAPERRHGRRRRHHPPPPELFGFPSTTQHRAARPIVFVPADPVPGRSPRTPRRRLVHRCSSDLHRGRLPQRG